MAIILAISLLADPFGRGLVVRRHVVSRPDEKGTTGTDSRSPELARPGAQVQGTTIFLVNRSEVGPTASSGT